MGAGGSSVGGDDATMRPPCAEGAGPEGAGDAALDGGGVEGICEAAQRWLDCTGWTGTDGVAHSLHASATTRRLRGRLCDLVASGAAAAAASALLCVSVCGGGVCVCVCGGGDARCSSRVARILSSASLLDECSAARALPLGAHASASPHFSRPLHFFAASTSLCPTPRCPPPLCSPPLVLGPARHTHRYVAVWLLCSSLPWRDDTHATSFPIRFDLEETSAVRLPFAGRLLLASTVV